MAKLIDYGGNGYEGVYELGYFHVKYGEKVKAFGRLSEARSFYNSLNEEKALWEVTRMELLEAYVWDNERLATTDSATDEVPF